MKNIYDTLLELKKKHNDKKIELEKQYYVSEWSWNPICDGYGVYPEIIRYVQEIDGYKVYTTGENYRYYFAWDIHEIEDNARNVTDVKDSYGYDWCTKIEGGLIDKKLIVNILK